MKKDNQPSVRSLAKAANVNASTVSRFLKAHPLAPRNSQDAFCAFYEINRVRSADPSDQTSVEYSSERLKKLRADRRLAEKRLAILEGNFLPRADVEALVSSLASELKEAITGMTRILPQQFPGLTPPQVREKMQTYVDTIFSDHRTGRSEKMDKLETNTKLASAQSGASRAKSRNPKK